MLANTQILQVNWQDAENELRIIRTKVFIEEQQVAPEFEWDEIDATAVHLLAMLENLPIACLRIIKYQKIGRMAVLKEYRAMGLGMALLLEAIKICKKQGTKSIYLTAQTHAIGFYKQAGFKEISAVYQDANIPHVDMQLILA
jgi:predicted GNAT family N-acyltransferase